MKLSSSIKDSAFNFCTMFSESQKLHDEQCKDANCRLRKGVLRKRDDLVAASLLQYALREQGFARQFQTFAHHLRGVDESQFRADVGQVFGLTLSLSLTLTLSLTLALALTLTLSLTLTLTLTRSVWATRCAAAATRASVRSTSVASCEPIAPTPPRGAGCPGG